jgi:hypothetical protein
MTKHVPVPAVAIILCVSSAFAQGILQRSDWRQPRPETYLPPPGLAVSWLWLNTETKLPKGDIPLGRDIGSTGDFTLPPGGANSQVSSNAEAASRSI